MGFENIKPTMTSRTALTGTLTVKDLKTLLNYYPDEARVSFDHCLGDPRDQRDYSYTSLIVTWGLPKQGERND